MMTMMGFGIILPLILIGVVAYSLGWRAPFNPAGQAQTTRTPEEILRVRYAGGEISREAYDQMRRHLEG